MRGLLTSFRSRFRFWWIPFYVLLIASFLLALLGFVRVVPALIRVPSQLDFGAYYVAGRILNVGMALYHPTPFDDATLGITGIQHSGYIYPPFFAAVLRPLALMPYRMAESVWFVINILLYGGLCTLLTRLTHIPKHLGVALLLTGLLLPAVYDTWLLGQISMLLSVLLVGSLILATQAPQRTHNDVLAGMLLGLAAAIKIYPIILAGVYLMHRRWSALFGVALSLAGALLIGIGFGGGWETTHYWFISVLPSASTMSPFPSNQSLRGVIARFFTANTFQVPVLDKNNFVSVTLTPVLNSPNLSTVIFLLGSAAILSISAWFMLRRRALAQTHLITLDFAIGTTVMLLITPVVWDFYYVHLLLSLVLLAFVFSKQAIVLLAFAIACLLLSLQRYWRYALLEFISIVVHCCSFQKGDSYARVTLYRFGS